MSGDATHPTEQLSAEAALQQTGTAADVWLLLYTQDEGRLIPLSEGEAIVIGRGRSADVSIDDSSLSRRHVRLWVSRGRLRLEDLGSRNGTQLRGSAVRRAVTVHPGDEVRLGRVALLVQRGGLPEGVRGIESYDVLARRLPDLLRHATSSGEELALLLVRARGARQTSFARCCWRFQRSVGPRDHVALYGRSSALVVLSGRTTGEIVRAAEDLVTSAEPAEPDIVGGLACFPADGQDSETLLERARSAAQLASLERPLVRAADVTTFGEAEVQETPSFKQLLLLIGRVARSPLPVLLLGETGVGKEVLARALHRASHRPGLLVSVNCAAIPGSLIESTLFGHEKGAFTGAQSQRRGVFEEAHEGTVFLDEIGDLPLELQGTLLRALDSGEVLRVGAARPITVDTRVVAATHRDLGVLAERNEFRRDLLFRLNAVTVEVPPLRERRQEIMPLAKHFLDRAAEHSVSAAREFAADAAALLEQYAWPGNVRELRNAVERAVVMAETSQIRARDLPETVRHGATSRRSQEEGDLPPLSGSIQLRERIEALELALIREALTRSGGNQTEAARALGLPLRTFIYKLRKHGIGPKGER